MINEQITIINKLGLHARAAAKFVAHASRFASEIEVIKDERKVNGKSIMGVMTLAATKGSNIQLIINGEDEQDAFNDLQTLINNKFGEED